LWVRIHPPGPIESGSIQKRWKAEKEMESQNIRRWKAGLFDSSNFKEDCCYCIINCITISVEIKPLEAKIKKNLLASIHKLLLIKLFNKIGHITVE
jgi:hypothetical protein